MKKKKYIITGILVVLATIFMIFFAIKSTAENVATENTKEIKDEKSLVRMVASISRGMDENDKINKETLEEQLTRYAGSGVTTVTEQSSNILIVTYIASGREYPININTGYIETTSPYLPSGFTFLPGTDLAKGLTIQDSLGNQYVWVEVPRTTEVYTTSGLGITEFTDAEYESIEADWHAYTSVYRGGTYADEYISDDITGLTEAQYYTLKKKMLKSVYENGGFYVGKYETGIVDNPRTSGETASQTPVIKANAYAYNYVTCSQAQSLASSMLSGEFTSSLFFGIQWDLMVKYLETSGAATQTELLTDSTSWGNCQNSLWKITNTDAKYSTTSWLSGYQSAPYEKTTTSQYVILTTGASDTFCKQGIYDLLGNFAEILLAGHSSGSFVCVFSPCNATNNVCSKNAIGEPFFSGGAGNCGFRVCIF